MSWTVYRRRAQRKYAAIEAEHHQERQRVERLVREPLPLRADVRDPFEMARAANRALKGVA